MRRPRLTGIWAPVLVAVAADFALDLALAPPANAFEAIARAVSFPLGAFVAFLIGRWFGTRTWQKRGRKLTDRVLRRTLNGRTKPLMFITDRPDVPPSTWRRVLEVVGFAAGTSVILGSLMAVLGADPNVVRAVTGLASLVALWGAFILVPYWSAARMGIRVVDPIRWTILPLSRRYADRLKLSNGALLLLAVGAVFNLTFRAGASGDQALIAGVSTVATNVAAILVIAATGVAYYSVAEQAAVREMEAEAVAAGIRDGRGMSDGDFLPRLKPHG